MITAGGAECGGEASGSGSRAGDEVLGSEGDSEALSGGLWLRCVAAGGGKKRRPICAMARPADTQTGYPWARSAS